MAILGVYMTLYIQMSPFDGTVGFFLMDILLVISVSVVLLYIIPWWHLGRCLFVFGGVWHGVPALFLSDFFFKC